MLTLTQIKKIMEREAYVPVFSKKKSKKKIRISFEIANVDGELRMVRVK